MSEISKQVWVTPQLVLLGRGNPEEHVLGDDPSACGWHNSDTPGQQILNPNSGVPGS